MSIFSTPDQHAANPPASWVVTKHADRSWALCPAGESYDLATFSTKKEAEQAKVSGFLVNEYEAEGRWYAGETPPGRKSYAECLAEQKRNEAWQARRAAEREAERADAVEYPHVVAFAEAVAEQGPHKCVTPAGYIWTASADGEVVYPGGEAAGADGYVVADLLDPTNAYRVRILSRFAA